MAAQGFTRLRRWQWGRQTAFGTAVAATSIWGGGYRGAPDVNPNWQDPDVDSGTLDRGAPLFRTSSDLTAQVEGKLDYNTAHKLAAATLLGGVSATGAGLARTWAHQPSSTTADPFEYFTGEWGDEVAADQVQLRDGVIERLELTFPEDLGPIAVNATWRYGAFAYPTARASLAVSSNLVWAYAADAEVFINDSAATIGTTKLSDIIRGGSIVVENTVDLKRYANGSNTRFQVGAYGRSARKVTASLRMEKQTLATDEVVDFLAADPVNRFLEVRVTSPTIITGSTPYSSSIRLPGNWIGRGNGEIGGNAVLDMELDGYYDATLGYPIRWVNVNSVSSYS